jgi:hypothetical protein
MYFSLTNCISKISLLFLLLGGWAPVVLPHAYGQLSQTIRYEVEIAPRTPAFEVASAGSKGLLLYRTFRAQIHDTNSTWEVIKLDTALQENWRQSFVVNERFTLKEVQATDESIYFLFTDFGTTRWEITLVSLDILTGKALAYPIRNFIPFHISDFHVNNHSILVGGYFNLRPLVLHYSLTTGQSRILPGFFSEKGDILQIKTNRDHTMDVLLSGPGPDKKKTIFLKTYDPEGTLLKNITLEVEGRRSLIFGQAHQKEGADQLVAGVYGIRTQEYSRGVFVSNINAYGEYDLSYYNYGELKNFFSYMKSKREQRVRNRIARRQMKNKQLRFSYRLLVHDMVEYRDQYILLGEAFYPRYKNADNMGFWAYQPMSPYRNSQMVLDSYRYTHAVVLGFDKTGKLLWDNSFEINDVETKNLERNVHMAIQDEEMVLLYQINNVLRSKIIRNNEVVEGKSFDEIRLLFDDDILQANDTRGRALGNWYGNTFYACGVQTIRNIHQASIKPIRQVFFVNKIEYR